MTLTGCKELWSDDMIVLPHRTFPYQALELLQGKQFNMSQTPNGFTIGGGLKSYTSTITFPQNFEYAQDVFPVTVSNATADALKVDTNTERVFTFGNKTYTFKATKVFHFEETQESAATDIQITKTGSPDVRWDEPKSSNDSWNTGAKTNWQNSKTGSGDAHVLAMKLGDGKSVTISIDMSKIGEFDYVEFSTNTFTGGASTIMIKNSAGDDGKLVYKPYVGKSNGIGFGDWKKEDNKDFLPVLGNGWGDDYYYNKNESFVVAGAWNSKDSDEAILFMQNGFTNSGTTAADLENQAAALLKREDRSRLYNSGNNAKFEFTITAPDDKPHYFDYIAFFKKQ